MKNLHHMWRELVRLVEQAWARTRAAAGHQRERWQQPNAKALELERLDRIRNPAKYLGKP